MASSPGRGFRRDHALRIVGRGAFRDAAQGVDLALELAGVLRFGSHLIDKGLCFILSFLNCLGIGSAEHGNPGLGQQ